MKLFLVLCVALTCSCGGSDNTPIDGGNDATTSDSPSSDGTSGDVASGDSGNQDSSTSDTGTGDSGTGDAGMGGDGSTLFPCGTTTCDSATQYCNLQEIGPQPADGGFVGTATCLTYPGACGSTPSCSCIPSTLMCSCTQSGPDVTKKCGGV